MLATCLLLAEFDVDKGSVVRHVYPDVLEPPPFLADLMLPDGAHLRAEDWTTFYLGRLSAAPGFADHARPDQLKVLNLVRTKKDETAKRGARVKALAVCSTRPWLQVFKPILVLALEEFFRAPTVATLAAAFDAINALSTHGMPELTRIERIILRTCDRTDVLAERFPAIESFERGSAPDTEASTNRDEDDEPLADQRMPLDGGIGSAAATSAAPRPRLALPQNNQRTTFGPPGDDPAGGGQVPGTEAGRATDALRTAAQRDTHFFESRFQYLGVSIPVRIPMASFEEDVGDYSLVGLIQTYSGQACPPAVGPQHAHLHTCGPTTPPLILLFNALITGKRVVFLGSGQAASVVSGHVLAACALASGSGAVLRGFCERAFPYTHLGMLDLHERTPGAIIGVTNPIFEELTARWDVLCHVETGKIVISKDLRSAGATSARPFSPATSESAVPPLVAASSASEASAAAPPPPGSAADPDGLRPRHEDAYDVAFVDELGAAIAAHDGEAIIRARIADYVQRFVRLASKHEEDVQGSTSIGFPSRAAAPPDRLGSGAYGFDARELAVNVPRIDAWRSTSSHGYCQADFRSGADRGSFVQVDLPYQIGRLRTARRLSIAEGALIYSTLARSLQDEGAILEVLAQLPSHMDGLLPLTFGLFHPVASTRRSAMLIFALLDAHPTGRKMMQSLNAFHRLALARLAAGENHA